MMDLPSLSLFLLFVVIGASVQTVAGFAMGLLIMGAVAILDIAPIGFTAAVVSILSLVNTTLALRKTWQNIDVRLLIVLCAGLLPGLVIGVLVLESLNDASYLWLRRLLGGVIIFAGVLMTLKPQPWSRTSNKSVTGLFGFAGGIIGGMFSTGGAPLAFFMYRQPLEFHIIRASLLSVFAVTTLGRTLVLAASGGLTLDILYVAGLATPLVLAATFIAGRYVPASSAQGIRRFVFALLILIGFSLLYGS